jgi:hypothetical protein
VCYDATVYTDWTTVDELIYLSTLPRTFVIGMPKVTLLTSVGLWTDLMDIAGLCALKPSLLEVSM